MTTTTVTVGPDIDPWRFNNGPIFTKAEFVIGRYIADGTCRFYNGPIFSKADHAIG